ncbi:MAG TPA: hypothetical protein VF797_16155 [Noviherbaspirillum sp.]
MNENVPAGVHLPYHASVLRLDQYDQRWFRQTRKRLRVLNSKL